MSDQWKTVAIHKRPPVSSIEEMEKALSAGTAGIAEVRQFSPYFFIQWTITRNCNYSCSYCHSPPSKLLDDKVTPLRRNTNTFSSRDHYLGIASKLVALMRESNQRSGRISLIGGEPVTNPYFVECVETFATGHTFPLGLKIDIITNFSKPVSMFERIADTISRSKYPTKIHLHAAYHYEFLYGKKDEFLRKVKRVEELGIRIDVVFVFTRENIHFLSEIAKEFIVAGVKVIIRKDNRSSFGKLIDPFGPEEDRIYKEVFDLFHDGQERVERPHAMYQIEMNDGNTLQMASGNVFNRFELYDYKDFNCNAGFTSFKVEEDGRVARGISGCKTTYMGNILDDSFEIYDGPRPCSQTQKCNCISDLLLEKSRIKSS